MTAVPPGTAFVDIPLPAMAILVVQSCPPSNEGAASLDLVNALPPVPFGEHRVVQRMQGNDAAMQPHIMLVAPFPGIFFGPGSVFPVPLFHSHVRRHPNAWFACFVGWFIWEICLILLLDR